MITVKKSVAFAQVCGRFFSARCLPEQESCHPRTNNTKVLSSKKSGREPSSSTRCSASATLTVLSRKLSIRSPENRPHPPLVRKSALFRGTCNGRPHCAVGEWMVQKTSALCSDTVRRVVPQGYQKHPKDCRNKQRTNAQTGRVGGP